MLLKVKAAIIAVIFGIGSIFGVSTLGPFTNREKATAMEMYQQQIKGQVKDVLRDISINSRAHTVGYSTINLEDVSFQDTDFSSYNLVFQVHSEAVVKYDIVLQDGTLLCTSTLSSSAVFFKDHSDIRIASLSIQPQSSGNCKLSLTQSAGQNH